MVGQKIKELLHQQKRKKVDLAEYLGVQRNTLDDYINEKRYMTEDKIVATAKFFGVTISSLFQEPEKSKPEIYQMLLTQQKQIQDILSKIESR